MEPFGLFQILQSLLNANGVAPPAEREQSSEPTSQSAEKNAPDEPQNTSLEKDEATQSAILQFMEAHDARAKRIRK